MNFKSFALKDELKNTIPFKNATEVQQKVIPLALKRNNLIIQSQTGTGKTLAFLLPILNNVEIGNKMQTIILSPTFELASQIYKEAINVIKNSGLEINVQLLVKGTDKNKKAEKFETNKPNVVIGTPGKIKTMLFEESLFTIKDLKTIVFDEADMLLEVGFDDEIKYLLTTLKSKPQIIIASATIPKSLETLIKQFVKNVKKVMINTSHSKKQINHYLVNVKHKNKVKIVTEIIKKKQPYLSIVFVNNQKEIEKVYKEIKSEIKETIALHSELATRIRKNILEELKNNKYKIIVATDVMARGIDIEGVSHIFSLNVPFKKEYYVHRAGRSGRVELTGDSYLMYNTDELNEIEKIKRLGISFIKMNFTNGELKEDKRPRLRPNKKKSSEEKEVIAVIATTKSRMKKKGVKPGYRKRMKKEVEGIKRKKLREKIKTNIKKIKKQKAKERQIKLKLVQK